MKTIFITSFHPIISRNILSTDITKFLLKESDVRIVVLCRPHKVPFFAKEFGSDRVIIEGLEKRSDRRDRLMRTISFAALWTRSIAIKRVTEMNGSGKYLRFVFAPKIGPVFVRIINRLLIPKDTFRSLFDRYKPTVIFSTDIQNAMDVRLLESARAFGVKTVSMVRSWDNLTSKGLVRFVPDMLLVHNHILEGEAVTLHGVPKGRIAVVGIPHYDAYAKAKETAPPRGAAGQKLVLYAPVGDRYLKNNTVDRDVVDLLVSKLPPEYSVIVRLPFSDTVELLDSRSSSSRVTYDRPPSHFEMLKNNELSTEDEKHLIETLQKIDVCISGPSTMAIDAAYFGKPAILVDFDGNEIRPFFSSIRRFYEYEHFVALKKTDGIVFAKTADDLIKETVRLAQAPEASKAGLDRVVRAECFSADGHSSERVADAILKFLR